MVVPNPCSVAQGPPVEVATRPGFAFIGRFTVEKGAEVLAQVLRGTTTRLTALGDGPCAGTLRQVSPFVTVRSWGTSASVLEVLERSRALLFPSLWPETQGLVACEALARGVPVIASHGTGAAELVHRTGGGICVPPGDATALANAIEALKDSAVATRLGSLAYDGYWAAPFTVERHAAALLETYTDALARAAAPRLRPRHATAASRTG